MAGRKAAEPAKAAPQPAPRRQGRPRGRHCLPASRKSSSRRSPAPATSFTGRASSRPPSCTMPTSPPASTAGRAAPGSRRSPTATARPDWSEATAVPNLDAVTAQAPLDGATFAEAPRGRARREELCRVEQGARRLALPERRGGAPRGEDAEAHLQSRRERGRFPHPPRPGLARAPRPRGREAPREARGEAQVARRTACSARPTGSSARKSQYTPAQARHRDLDRHVRARRDLRRPQRRRRRVPDPRRAPPGACSASAATSRAPARASRR